MKMKKTIGLLVLSGVMVFGLSACNNDSTTTSANSANYKINNNTSVQDKGLTIKEYAVQIIPKMNSIEGDLSELEQISGDLANNPTLMFESNYQSLIRESCDQFYNDIQDIKNMDIGNNSDVEAIHQLLLDAMDEYEFVSTNFPDAVTNADTDLIEQCTQHMQQGSSFMQQTTDKTKEITGDNL